MSSGPPRVSTKWLRRLVCATAVTALVLVPGIAGSDTQSARGEIAFVDAKDTGVFAIRPTGGDPQRLARSAATCCLAWSIDGNAIAYSSYGRGVFVVRADGSGRRRLTTHDEGETSLSWSPDGRSIAFDRNYDGIHYVWVAAANGGGARQLTPRGYYAPDWSPDGRLIAFVGASYSRPGVWTMSPSGGEMRRLTGSRLDGYPVWSHDGRRLVFMRGGAVWVMNADGRRQWRLVSVKGSEETGELRWSPDDQVVAFTRKQGDRDVFVVSASGGQLRNLTANSRLGDSCPSWSPDGRTIAFSSNRSGRDEIYLMNRDGGSLRRLGRSIASCPTWSPRP